jgi:hypothetical protein
MKTEGLPCEGKVFTGIKWRPNIIDKNSHVEEEQQRTARA